MHKVNYNGMSDVKKTFIILSPGFPKDEADSTCLPFPQLFVRTLSQLNPTINIIVFAFQYPFIAKDYKWYDVQVMSFNGRNKGKINRLLLWRRILKRFNEVIKEHTVIGILNFWLGECALIGQYAGKRYGINSFTWILGQDAKSITGIFRS